jgi:hypothetical protein
VDQSSDQKSVEAAAKMAVSAHFEAKANVVHDKTRVKDDFVESTLVLMSGCHPPSSSIKGNQPDKLGWAPEQSSEWSPMTIEIARQTLQMIRDSHERHQGVRQVALLYHYR